MNEIKSTIEISKREFGRNIDEKETFIKTNKKDNIV